MSKNTELKYWNKAAKDPEVDEKYICEKKYFDKSLNVLNVFIDKSNPGNVLDLGCGVGRLTIPLSQIHAFTDHDFYGVDISHRMIKVARDRGIIGSKISFSVNDGRTLPFVDNFFTAAYSVLVFQHINFSTIEQYIKELARVIRKGGLLKIQFIEGDEDEPFSKHHNLNAMHVTLAEHGFRITKTVQGLIHDQWTWIEVSKI